MNLGFPAGRLKVWYTTAPRGGAAALNTPFKAVDTSTITLVGDSMGIVVFVCSLLRCAIYFG
mgnify:CR=1 FL=1